ncbi:MAG: hypothetical protein AB7N71_02315 [Phycisphaerae bacterium]
MKRRFATGFLGLFLFAGLPTLATGCRVSEDLLEFVDDLFDEIDDDGFFDDDDDDFDDFLDDLEDSLD